MQKDFITSSDINYLRENGILKYRDYKVLYLDSPHVIECFLNDELNSKDIILRDTDLNKIQNKGILNFKSATLFFAGHDKVEELYKGRC